jgi:hypothetical protein
MANQHEAGKKAIVFYEREQWHVLLFRPFTDRTFDTLVEAHTFARQSMRIKAVLADVFSADMFSGEVDQAVS